MCLENMDFSSSSWMSSLTEGQTVTRTVDGNVFTISSYGNIAYINGFPVTMDEWNQALSGKKVILTFLGKKASLTSIGSNVFFNGRSMTEGSNISTQVSHQASSTSGTQLSETGIFLRTILPPIFFLYFYCPLSSWVCCTFNKFMVIIITISIINL